MHLIGKLDSPYVRRVAIAMTLMEMRYTHDDLSVFRDFERFASVNPVVKAPTLVADNGVTLMDSTLILDYLERIVPAGKSLLPTDMDAYLRAQRITGLALAACEKTVQIVYERQLRPADRRHEPWIERVMRQLHAAYGQLEGELPPAKPRLFGPRMMLADVTTEVAWRFTQDVLPGHVPESSYSRLATFARKAESEVAFLAVQPT
jgi:glutathione S-transferase